MELPDKKSGIQSRRTGITVFVLLLAAILAIAAFVYLKSQNADFKNISVKNLIDAFFTPKGRTQAERTISEIRYQANESPAICVYKDFIVKCTTDYLTFLDKKGEEQWSTQVVLAKPMVKACGNYLVAADIGGKDILVIEGKEVKWNKSLGDKIVNVDINKNGYTTVVHDAKDFKAAVTVFNSQGIERYQKSIVESFVLSACILSSGKDLLINKVDISGVKAGSILEYNNMSTEGPPDASVKLEDGIAFGLWGLPDDTVVIASDTSLKCFDKSGNKKWENGFSNILSAGICQEKYVVAATSVQEPLPLLSGNKSNITVLNSKGKQAATCTIDGDIRMIQTYDDVIAAVSGKEVSFSNTHGKVLGKYTSKADVYGVYFFNRDEAAIVTKSNVAVIKVR